MNSDKVMVTDLVKKYKENYSIPNESIVTEEMVLKHWHLEQKLTKELLSTEKENRWEVFERCYTILYNELDWLNQLVHADIHTPPKLRYRSWVDAIGSNSKEIYEIGSGKGAMISYLSTLGHICKATEITRERGSKFLGNNENIQLGNTDGIHLDIFEAVNSFDIVLSDQVIEHFHPEDVLDHFKSVYKILKHDGRYIFSTPHVYTGPHDVSKVFDYSSAAGMHLKEYTFKELISIAKIAGFKDISYGYKFSYEMNKTKLSIIFIFFGISTEKQNKIFSKIFLKIVIFSEIIISIIPEKNLRKIVTKFLSNLRLFVGNIFLDLSK